MLQNILNLEGVAVLSKEQQKNVNGGYRQPNVLAPLNPGGNVKSACVIKVTQNGSTSAFESVYYGSSNSAISQSANSACLDALYSPSVTRCTYDCAYDGYGN